MLPILTSKEVLCNPFPGLSHLFWCFNVFSIKMEKVEKVQKGLKYQKIIQVLILSSSSNFFRWNWFYSIGLLPTKQSGKGISLIPEIITAAAVVRSIKACRSLWSFLFELKCILTIAYGKLVAYSIQLVFVLASYNSPLLYLFIYFGAKIADEITGGFKMKSPQKLFQSTKTESHAKIFITYLSQDRDIYIYFWKFVQLVSVFLSKIPYLNSKDQEKISQGRHTPR